MVVPALLVVLADLALPYGMALKVVAVTGSLASDAIDDIGGIDLGDQTRSEATATTR
jgi:hypothetical protein